MYIGRQGVGGALDWQDPRNGLSGTTMILLYYRFFDSYKNGKNLSPGLSSWIAGHNSYLIVIGVYEIHGRMHPSYSGTPLKRTPSGTKSLSAVAKCP